MNALPDFDPTAFGGQLDALARLAARVQNAGTETATAPRPGSFSPAPSAPVTISSPGELRQRLADWIAPGKITGWLLTTEALVLLETDPAPLADEPILAAELHRATDDTSLNLRHTPRGWLWEELRSSSEHASADSFIEESACLVNLPSNKSNPDFPNNQARYHVEWRLTPALDDGPATFRPARSRFVGWA